MRCIEVVVEDIIGQPVDLVVVITPEFLDRVQAATLFEQQEHVVQIVLVSRVRGDHRALSQPLSFSKQIGETLENYDDQLRVVRLQELTQRRDDTCNNKQIQQYFA